MSPSARSDDTVVLVPIRSFDDAKTRLAGRLDAGARRRLVQRMAARVVAAAGSMPVRVVSDDPEVTAWATVHGATPLAVGVNGLNAAVTAAVEAVTSAGAGRVIVAHADLPFARDLHRVSGHGIAIAPDRARDGSNVVNVPTGVGFRFAYGPGSFERHCDEAMRLGLPFTIVDASDLAWDVDDPADLPEEC